MTAGAPAAGAPAGSEPESEREREREERSAAHPGATLAEFERWTPPGVLRSIEVIARDERTGAVWLREPHAFQFTGRSGVPEDALARQLVAYARAQAIEQALWAELDWPERGC